MTSAGRAHRAQRARLQDIDEAIVGIETAVAGLSFEAYAANWLVRRTVERALEILSEASRHLPETLKTNHPAIAWRQIADLGNVLRHEYHRVDDRLVWNAVQRHLPALAAVIRKALAELDP